MAFPGVDTKPVQGSELGSVHYLVSAYVAHLMQLCSAAQCDRSRLKFQRSRPKGLGHSHGSFPHFLIIQWRSGQGTRCRWLPKGTLT